MRAIEFYTTPSGEVTIKEQGQPERQLKESDTDFIQSFLEILEEFYPEAYAALRKYYARYDGNKCYRDFLAVRRFIKCNFGLYDNMIDVDENWNFKFEFVGCPLRGECDGFKKICEPKFNSTLSDSQLRVMELCYYGKKDEEIAETLFISSHTVKNTGRTFSGNSQYTPWRSSCDTRTKRIYLRANNHANRKHLSKHTFFTKDRDRIPCLANHKDASRYPGIYRAKGSAPPFREAERGKMGLGR